MNQYPQRIHPRLKQWDYNSAGSYFLTFCTKEKKPVLSTVVGRGILDAPHVEFTGLGRIVADTIRFVAESRMDISIDESVIMPNHVHILITINKSTVGGASGMPRPTNQTVPKLVSSLKRYSNRRCGRELWQDGYYDHIIRDEDDYYRILEYIQTNPAKWLDDRYYVSH